MRHEDPQEAVGILAQLHRGVEGRDPWAAALPWQWYLDSGPFQPLPYAPAPLHHCRPVGAEVRTSKSVHEMPRVKNELVFRNLRARGFHFVCVIYLMCLLLQACRRIGHHLAVTLV